MNFLHGTYLGVSYDLRAFLAIFLVILVVDLALKAFSLWKSARSGQKFWFIFLLIVNSVGLLPIIYLLFFQKKAKNKNS